MRGESRPIRGFGSARIAPTLEAFGVRLTCPAAGSVSVFTAQRSTPQRLAASGWRLGVVVGVVGLGVLEPATRQ
jgi:hypothetical protein